MIKIALCDDELTVIKSIARLVESAIITLDFDAEIIMVTTNQNLVCDKIKNHEIDILFLDIDFNKNGKNGIEFALELRKLNKDFKLIFVTGHFQYSLLAFKCKTFDYLMKPADNSKVLDVLARLKADYTESSTELLKVNKDCMLRPKDILFIERNKSKAIVYTKDSSYESCDSLNTIMENLPNSFIRIHRSYIVNPNKIVRIDKDEKLIYFESNISCPLGQFQYKK